MKMPHCKPMRPWTGIMSPWLSVHVQLLVVLSDNHASTDQWSVLPCKGLTAAILSDSSDINKNIGRRFWQWIFMAGWWLWQDSLGQPGLVVTGEFVCTSSCSSSREVYVFLILYLKVPCSCPYSSITSIISIQSDSHWQVIIDPMTYECRPLESYPTAF